MFFVLQIKTNQESSKEVLPAFHKVVIWLINQIGIGYLS